MKEIFQGSYLVWWHFCYSTQVPLWICFFAILYSSLYLCGLYYFSATIPSHLFWTCMISSLAHPPGEKTISQQSWVWLGDLLWLSSAGSSDSSSFQVDSWRTFEIPCQPSYNYQCGTWAFQIGMSPSAWVPDRRHVEQHWIEHQPGKQLCQAAHDLQGKTMCLEDTDFFIQHYHRESWLIWSSFYSFRKHILSTTMH